MFQLAFPQPSMLNQGDLDRIQSAAKAGVSKAGIQHLVEPIRQKLNPHPANQKTENVPRIDGEEIPGMQHKYRETALFFPSEVSKTHTDSQSPHLISCGNNRNRDSTVMHFAHIAFAGHNSPL